MKKILCFTVAVLLVAALSINCFAAGNLKVQQVTKANPNESFSVDIYLENNPGVQSVTVNLKYEHPEYFTVIGYVNGNVFPVAIESYSSNMITLNFYATELITQDGKLATVKFFCSDLWTGSAFSQIGVNGIGQTPSGQVDLASNSILVNWNLNENDWTLNQDTTLEDEDIWVEDPDNGGGFWDDDTDPDIEIDEDDEDEDIVIDDDGQVEITVTRETEATTEKTTKTEKTTEETTKKTEKTTEKTTEATTTTTQPTTPAVTTPPSETVTLPVPATTDGATEALGNVSQESSGRATGGTVAASIVVMLVTVCTVLCLKFYRKVLSN